MTLARRLKSAIDRERFYPGLFGFFTNPNFIVRRQLARAVATQAPHFDRRVLDFGCGSKPYESFFTSAESYTGVDIEISGHDHQTSRVDVFYDGETLPFADASFDHGVSFETFEHVPNIETMLAELARVVRPGGLLLVTTPFAYPEHETPYDFRRLTRFGWRRLLDRAGFDVEEEAFTGGFVLTLGQLWSTYVKRLSGGSRIGTTLLHLLFGLPVMCVAYGLNALLPRSNDLYLGIVIRARRRGAA